MKNIQMIGYALMFVGLVSTIIGALITAFFPFANDNIFWTFVGIFSTLFISGALFTTGILLILNNEEK